METTEQRATREAEAKITYEAARAKDAAEIVRLKEALMGAGERAVKERDQYMELIMSVSRKFEGETRHETALRYIQNAEVVTTGSAKENGVTPTEK